MPLGMPGGRTPCLDPTGTVQGLIERAEYLHRTKQTARECFCLSPPELRLIGWSRRAADQAQRHQGECHSYDGRPWHRRCRLVTRDGLHREHHPDDGAQQTADQKNLRYRTTTRP